MLSKTKFVKGEQCERALWLYVHRPEAAIYSEAQLRIFKKGNTVGELARKKFPGGILAVDNRLPGADSARRTRELIEAGVETIYEATFIHDDVLAAIDVLTRKDGQWHLYECKSTTEVKPQHINDVALQYHVVTNQGLTVADASVMYLNNRYVRQGELDPARIFKSDSVIGQVKSLQAYIGKMIPRFKKLVNGDDPCTAMGDHCTKPYPCEFQEFCRSESPQTESDEPLDDTPNINVHALLMRLERYGYPLYYLDFETIAPVLPLFDNSRPYQKIPFQYSLHYQHDKDSNPEHFEFLHQPGSDPREELIRTLIRDTYRPGKILTYNVSFERTCLNELSRDFPEYQDQLSGIIGRLEDLMEVFRQREIHFPTLGRGYSIKKVLPLMVPEMSYENLEINRGDQASWLYEDLFESQDMALVEGTLNNLRVYCRQDTLAMVKIMEKLNSIG